MTSSGDFPTVPQLWGAGPAPWSVPLGAFVLQAPIARGGMGQIWQGIHPGQGVPVAVKVMTAEQLRVDDFREAFEREVRAVAALDHEGIVIVFDHGIVDEFAQMSSNGELEAGSPYLVMELATGGTLHGARLRTYEQLEGILLRLLDALAHAHARGVIHRDLKPGNVLLPGPFDLRQSVKLTDFGTAHAVDQGLRSGSQEQLFGTLQYMPPEQIEGRWRDYGPWTDLYALGCVAWRLATGNLPFPLKGAKELLHAHLYVEAPPFEPRIDVPDGLGDWLRRLLQKSPGDRFQRAAEAAWALQQLGLPTPAPETQLAEPEDPEPEDSDGPREEIDLDDFAPVTRATWAPQTLTLPRQAIADSDLLDPYVSGAASDVPPIPERWHQPAARPRTMRLIGAGLGLYGMRAVSLVDRKAERDRIWRLLRDVQAGGSARLLLLQGEAGYGKSRLVEWICERAHELGAATVLQATHSANRGRSDGLGPMVARHLGTPGLDRDETVQRLELILRADGLDDPDEVDALTEFVLPRNAAEREAGARGVVFSSSTERHVLVRRLLEREAERRMVILWLDDAQWGHDVIDFAALLLRWQSMRRSPVLILMTVRSDALEAESLEEYALDSLMRFREAERMHVGPLDDTDSLELVEELLCLSGELARDVASRAGGNPMFAIQLVGDWVQRGRLRPASHGFELSDDDTTVPDDIQQVWEAPLERLLAERPGDDRNALELAATLGREVEYAEWDTICERAGTPPTADLLDSMIAAGLARGGHFRFLFVHGLLRETIERMARDAGRWEAHNRLCAEVFGAEGGSPVRLGMHLVEAGDVVAGVEPLLEGASKLVARGEYSRAVSVLDRREQAMRRADLPASDEAWPRGRLVRIGAMRRMGQMDQATKLLDRVTASKHWDSWSPELEVRSCGDRASHLHALGLSHEAVAVAEEGERIAEAHCEPIVVARVRRILGGVYAELGELDFAEALARTAGSEYAAAGDDVGRWECELVLFTALKQAGRLDEAAAILERAKDFHEQTGRRQDVAGCLNNLGEVERLRGNLGRAETCYRAARVIFESIGAAGRTVVDANLGLVLLERRQYTPAREVLSEALTVLQSQGRRSFAGVLHAALLPCAAGELDWTAFDEHLVRADERQRESGFVDIDAAKCAGHAGNLALLAGERNRALSAWRWSLSQWRAADRVAQALSTERKIAQHDDP